MDVQTEARRAMTGIPSRRRAV